MSYLSTPGFVEGERGIGISPRGSRGLGLPPKSPKGECGGSAAVEKREAKERISPRPRVGCRLYPVSSITFAVFSYFSYVSTRLRWPKSPWSKVPTRLTYR